MTKLFRQACFLSAVFVGFSILATDRCPELLEGEMAAPRLYVENIRVLYVGHTKPGAEKIARALNAAGRVTADEELTTVSNLDELDLALARGPWDLIVFAGGNAEAERASGRQRVRQNKGNGPWVVVTPSAERSPDRKIVRWMRAGAMDFHRTRNLRRLGVALDENLTQFARQQADRARRERDSRDRASREFHALARPGVPNLEVLMFLMKWGGIASYVTDSEGTVTFTNPAFNEAFGFDGKTRFPAGKGEDELAFPPRDGWLNQSLSHVCAYFSHLGEEWQTRCFSMSISVLSNIGKVIRRMQTTELTEVMLDADGNLRELKVIKFPLDMGAGQISVGTLIFDDLTRGSMLDHIKAMYDSSPGANWIMNDNGKIVYSNLGARRLLGDRLVPNGFLSDVTDRFQDPGRLTAALRTAMEGRHSRGELQVKGHNSLETRTLEFTFEYQPSRATAWGEPVVFVRAEDVTLIRKLEAEVEKLEKFAALGTSVHQITHDLKDVLSGILQPAILMLAELSDDKIHHTDLDFRADLAGIVDMAKAADAKARRIMSLGSGKAGEKLPFPAKELHEFLSSFARRFRRELEVEAPPYLGRALVTGDFEALYSSVFTLVTNAREAGAKHLTISLFEETRDGQPFVIFSVKDNAGGVPEAIRGQIFEPFFTSGKAKGTGIGLAAARKVAVDHGGSLELVVEDGVGSDFRMVVPAKQPAATTATACEVPSCEAGKNILVVDDNPSLLAPAGRLLTKWGYRPEAVADGDGLRAAVHSNRATIAAVLLDKDVVGIDPDEAIRLVREAYPSAVIYRLSGFEPDNDGSLPEGVAAHFVKPVKWEEVRDALRRILPGIDTP